MDNEREKEYIITCPGCGNKYNKNLKYAYGRTMKCLSCNLIFIITMADVKIVGSYKRIRDKRIKDKRIKDKIIRDREIFASSKEILDNTLKEIKKRDKERFLILKIRAKNIHMTLSRSTLFGITVYSLSLEDEGFFEHFGLCFSKLNEVEDYILSLETNISSRIKK